MLAWTYIWAISEVGVDFWTLLPRLSGPFLFGLFFLTPWYRRSLISGPRPALLGRAVVGGFAVALLGLFGWGFAKGDIHEIAATRPLPEAKAKYTQDTPEGEWHHYGNDQHGTRFSPLEQINPENVRDLQVAWTYRTGDYPPPEGPVRRLQATPLKIGRSLYLCTARNDIVSLDAETGQENWRFNSHTDLTGVTGSAACRGVAYYQAPESAVPAGAACAERIIGGTVDARLLAVDAATGEPCADFLSLIHI